MHDQPVTGRDERLEGNLGGKTEQAKISECLNIFKKEIIKSVEKLEASIESQVQPDAKKRDENGGGNPRSSQAGGGDPGTSKAVGGDPGTSKAGAPNERIPNSPPPYKPNYPVWDSETHQYPFTLADYKPSHKFMCGVISTSKADASSVLENPTFFGWREGGTVCLGEKKKNKYDGYEGNFKADDTFLLTVNIPAKEISLKFNSSNRTYELPVCTDICPTPWKVVVYHYE